MHALLAGVGVESGQGKMVNLRRIVVRDHTTCPFESPPARGTRALHRYGRLTNLLERIGLIQRGLSAPSHILRRSRTGPTRQVTERPTHRLATTREQSVNPVEILQRRNVDSLFDKGERQRLVAHMERLLTGRRKSATQPAGVRRFGTRPSRVPDLHGSKVRATRVRLTNLLHNADLSLLKKLMEFGQTRMQAEPCITENQTR